MAEKVIIGNAELWHGDCREVLPLLPKFDMMLTDPPYPDYLAAEFGYCETLLREIGRHDCRQFIFWSAKADFPLSYSAIHVWAKTGAGAAAAYERIFERNGGRAFRVFKGNAISNQVMAQFAHDEFCDHPTQKPVSLIVDLLLLAQESRTVCDPFVGSGTTGVACAKLGKAFVGVERERKYFDMACEHIARAQAQGQLIPHADEPQIQAAML